MRQRNTDLIKERFYGVATRVVGPRLKAYNERVHVLADADIPRDGENVHFVEPAGGRNLFMTWFRLRRDAVYVYREWPGSDYIPGHGVPGPWAVPDGRHPDGKRGPAQSPLGWGLSQYKREIARLEGWTAAEQPPPHGVAEVDWVARWREEEGTREPIERRFIDSRYASAQRLERDRPTTLLEDFADINLFFETTPGLEITDSVQLLATLLAYDAHREVDYFNRPRLFIAHSCVNTRYSLRTWTGDDGQKGACKDPMDNLLYFAASRLVDWSPEPEEEEDDHRVSDFGPQRRGGCYR